MNPDDFNQLWEALGKILLGCLETVDSEAVRDPAKAVYEAKNRDIVRLAATTRIGGVGVLKKFKAIKEWHSDNIHSIEDAQLVVDAFRGAA